ncbi:MAG TPA: type IX secretion system membrane protein PorP/SprF [Mucilaginibacter sp.]|jgi:type IX secretion system PorP/SprF family membrane protein|nr:type IX secretion system membrane protein PorP/SprF [Mucilaginibacter sp.]
MKRLLLLILISVLTFGLASAQQKPQYTQYVLNNLLINPAVTGIENYFDVKTGYRSQWTGLQGAPVTSYITGSVPFGSDFVGGDAAALSGGNQDNPYGRLYSQGYVAAPPHHGLGFMVVSDQAGPIGTTNIDLTYAYHMGISSTFNLALGVEAGYNHTSLNTSELVLENPLDPAIANGNNSQWKPDLGIGIWGYSSNYYFGISALQLLSQNLYFSTNNNYSQAKTVPQFFVTGGVKLFLNDDVTLMPSALVKFISPLPVTYDINAKLAFRSRFWIGASYRNGDAVAGMFGLNISSLINVSYSYDYTTSALRTVSSGTHEIILGIMLNNRNHLVGPEHSF